MPSDVRVDDIINALRERILTGEFGTGGRLPSHRMLAKQYNTTHETINKVMQRLQAEGLLLSLGRQGVFVRAARTRLPATSPRFASYLQQLGLKPIETTIDGPDIVPASQEVAQALGIAEHAPVVHRLFRQGTATEHYRMVENFFPVEFAGGVIVEQMQQDEQFDVLQAIQQVHGKAIKRVHEDLIGRLPTQREQDLLKVIRSMPVLEVHRVSYAEDDKTVILYSRLIFVASYFVFSYDYAAPQRDSFDEKMQELARIDPRSVLVEATAQVEREAALAVDRLKLDRGAVAPSSAHENMKILLQHHYIDRGVMDIWAKIQDVRNRSVHSAEEVTLTPTEALEYAALAKRLIQKLVSLNDLSGVGV